MVMAMAACSIIVCVIVLDLHHRNSDTPVPDWVRWLLLGRLSRCLGFSVGRCDPGNTGTGTDRNRDCRTNDRHRCNKGRSGVGDRAKGSSERLRATGQHVSTDLRRCSLADLEQGARRQNYVVTDKTAKELGGAKWNERRRVQSYIGRTHRRTYAAATGLERPIRRQNFVFRCRRTTDRRAFRWADTSVEL